MHKLYKKKFKSGKIFLLKQTHIVHSDIDKILTLIKRAKKENKYESQERINAQSNHLKRLCL